MDPRLFEAAHPRDRMLGIHWHAHVDGPEYDTFACTFLRRARATRPTRHTVLVTRDLAGARQFAARHDIPWPAHWPTEDNPRPAWLNDLDVPVPVPTPTPAYVGGR